MSVWESVWVRIRGSRPTRWRRGWRKVYGVGGSKGPAAGFTWDEVQSRDGVDPPAFMRPRIVKQANALNHLRSAVAAAHHSTRVEIHVTSWYRSPRHNARVGGVRNSQHVQGRATDVRVAVVRTGGVRIWLEPAEVARLAERVPAFRNGGVGVYSSFTHLDHRAGRARWSG